MFPSIANTAVKAPKLPDISMGKIYFIISGINVLNNPEHIPWSNLAIRNSMKLGISVNRFITKPKIVVIKRHYLYIVSKYFLDLCLINSRAKRDPIPPPKNTEQKEVHKQDLVKFKFYKL